MLIPAPGVHHATGPDGTAILDVRRGRWVMLDTDASRIWTALTIRGTLTGLGEEIAVPAGLDRYQVDAQVRAFAADLLARGLLMDTDRPQPRRRWRWWR